MTGAFPTERGSVSHEAPGPVSLAAPLREAWNVALDFPWGSRPPILGMDGLLIGHHKGKLLAIDPTTRQVLWKRKANQPLVLHDGYVMTCEGDELRRFSLRTGELVYRMRTGAVESCVVENGTLVAQAWNYEYDATAVYAWDWKTSQGLWSTPLGPNKASALTALSELLVYQVGKAGASEATTTARNIKTGNELWSRADLQALGDGNFLTVAADGLIAWVGDLLCIDPSTGRNRWRVNSAGGVPYVYQGRIYQCSWGGDYSVTDAKTGKSIFKASLNRTLPKSLQRAGPSNVAFVSETHVFIGAENGALFGFTRDKGEYVFNFHLPGAHKFSEVVCLDGRAYHRSGFHRLSCLEPRS